MDAVTDLLQAGAADFTRNAALVIVLGVPLMAIIWGASKLIRFLYLLVGDMTRSKDYY